MLYLLVPYGNMCSLIRLFYKISYIFMIRKSCVSVQFQEYAHRPLSIWGKGLIFLLQNFLLNLGDEVGGIIFTNNNVIYIINNNVQGGGRILFFLLQKNSLQNPYMTVEGASHATNECVSRIYTRKLPVISSC